MRTVLLILTILIIFKAELCYSQWIDVSNSDTDFYKVVKFRTENEGFIMGDNGLILKTIDGGDTWNELSYSISLNLIDFQFVNDSCIYAHSTDFLIKSDDSGISWTIPDSLPTYTSKIYFANSLNGFSCGGDGIFRSNDYGENWINVWNNNDSLYGFGSINDIKFLNDSTGIACGLKHPTGNGIYGIILRTDDFGISWHEVYNNSPWGEEILQIEIIDNIIYGITERGDLLKSSNSGTDWALIDTDLDTIISTINDIYFLNADTSFIVTSPSIWIPEYCYSTGKIIRTTDGWQTFTTQYISEIYPCIEQLLNSIVFINDSVGFSTGYGMILRTTNNGGNQNLIDTGSVDTLSIELVKNEIGIKVYPNPVENTMIIETSLKEPLTIEIINTCGKMLYNNRMTEGYTEINITEFKNGIYFLRLMNESKIEIVKIIKGG